MGTFLGLVADTCCASDTACLATREDMRGSVSDGYFGVKQLCQCFSSVTMRFIAIFALVGVQSQSIDGGGYCGLRVTVDTCPLWIS